MAKIVHIPNTHNCRAELAQLLCRVVGTRAECSCGLTYELRYDQHDRHYWATYDPMR